jgi:putative colanic acid biosynthesis acetyltransferase WcaF
VQESGVSTANAYRRNNTTLTNRIGRAAWGVVWLCLFRPTLRPMHRWRAALLRVFGAKLGRSCYIYAGARIWAPWNLVCGDGVGIADGAEIYNPSPVVLGDFAIISQQAYLCGATHDLHDPTFPMISAPIRVGEYAWICARATVQMGLTVGPGAILALGAIATHDLEPWSIYAGVPARRIKSRPKRQIPGETDGQCICPDPYQERAARSAGLHGLGCLVGRHPRV